MALMNQTPHDFILNFSKKDELRFQNFVHRTFNSNDCIFFLQALKNLYKNHGGLEHAFSNGFNKKDENVKTAISNFRTLFLSLQHLSRVEKHVSNPLSNSSAKRVCMYLRWMVRNDKQGVDFGIWKQISPAQLICPCDLHVDRVGRKLGLIKRKQTDWGTAIELTHVLRSFDPVDPVKYDFALFGLGVEEKF